MPPASDFAGGVDRCFQALERHWPEHTVGDVFFARPDKLDRTFRRARQQCGLGGVIGK